MADVLDQILSFRKKSLQLAKEKVSLSELERLVKNAGPVNRFLSAVTKPESISVIAEMKRKSPSAGVIREGFDPIRIANDYEAGGASALSILTDPDYFGGTIEDIVSVRPTTTLPILRKDFVFDVYQVVEARAKGADAILLIADMLDAGQLSELVACSKEVQIEPLVEIFTSEVIPKALNSKAQLIGINTRNLRTLEMKPDNISTLSNLIPKDRFIVAESGFKSGEDISRLKALRVSAVLVGESLLKSHDPKSAVQNLVNAGRRS